MQNTVPNQHRLAMVYRRLNGQATLEPIIVTGSDTGQQVFENVREKQHELSRKDSRLWFLNLLTTRLEVGLGEIRWVRMERSHMIPKLLANLRPIGTHGSERKQRRKGRFEGLYTK